jgi:hypothetical protein
MPIIEETIRRRENVLSINDLIFQISGAPSGPNRASSFIERPKIQIKPEQEAVADVYNFNNK